MGIASWILFGAIAGWLAGKLVGKTDPGGCLTNIVIGIAGAMLGGGIYTAISGHDYIFHFGLASLIVAVAGSTLLIVGLRAIGNRR